jgi:GNAT superfamily N-acetyltransferase
MHFDSSPEPLSDAHDRAYFSCAEPSLDHWLKRKALKNQSSGASRTFVLCQDQKVIAYYCLSAGAVSQHQAPKKMRRNMPDPLPVLVLGRLAIDKAFHNQGLGSALLRDAMFRAASVAVDAGVTAVLVHAISDQAKQFYLSRGFVASPWQPMTLVMPMKTILQILKE